MRRLIIGLFLILPTLTFAQDLRRDDGEWSVAGGTGGCIGGSTCTERRLRVELEDRPVIAVRFHAHDNIGQKADGSLRVKIDGNTVRESIDIPRKGETFTVEVDELRGRYLVFEPSANDEVEISQIAVLYGSQRGQRPRRDRNDWEDRPGRGNSSGGGWRSYPRAAGCIAGNECRRNGDRITVALEDAPVLGVRFYAHDGIGTKADGRLSVRIDDDVVSSYIDVKREGKRHEIEVESKYGSRLVIEADNDDEVDIKDVEVLYGRGSRRGGGGGGYGGGYGGGPRGRELTHEGGCIGGSTCGGRNSRIRIPIYGRPVESLRFYARDDIGERADGSLQIRIDDETITYSLDIKREGRTHEIDTKNIAGDYLIIEPSANDEVEIKDIRIRFRERD